MMTRSLKRRRPNAGPMTRAAASMIPVLAAAGAGITGAYRGITRQPVGRPRRNAIQSSVITTQKDLSSRYRRKSMPKWKRRKWRSFTKRVQHVMLQSQPLQSYCTDDGGSVKAVAADTQVTDGQMLGGTQATNNDELFQIFRAAYGAALTTTTVDKYHLFVKSMCLDIQFTNTHATNSAIVDVYTLLARKSINSATRIDVQYTNAFAEQGTLAIGAVSATHPATTPFQNGPFLQMWKVLNKRELLLGPGSVSTLQIRIPYNKYLSGKTVEICASQIPKLTRGILFQMRGVPQNNAGSPRLGATEVSWKSQITVVYGVPPSSTTSDATAEV